jgi:hypothetical protein
MPSSSPHPAGSASPAITGSAPPPEPGPGRQPATAGHTGLPLSIWPGVPGPGCPLHAGHLPPCPGHCPGPGARLVITAFSRPGDLVAIIPPAACPALAAALAGTGRRILGVTAGPPGPAERAGQRPPACRGGAHPGEPPDGARGTGQAALAVTMSCDGLPAGAANPGQAAPYPAARRALRPGGLLAVIAGPPAAGGIPDLGLAVARARAAGLVYAQHIILIHAAIDGEQLRLFPAPRPAAPSSLRESQPGAHIHTDLLIFSKHGSQ